MGGEGMCSGWAGGVWGAFVGSGFFLLCSGAAGVRGFLLLRVWGSVRLETAFRSCEISSACFPSLSASSEICSRSAATSSVLSSRRRLAAGGGVGGSEPGRPCFSLLWFIEVQRGLVLRSLACLMFTCLYTNSKNYHFVCTHGIVCK